MTKDASGVVTLALPPGVARWTLTGKSSADEVWAFDWWTMPGTGVANAAAWQSTTDGMKGVIQSTGLDAKLSAHLGTAGTISELKSIYYRNSQTATFVANSLWSPAIAGQSVTFMPYQQSLCVTLLTDLPGPSTRGRLYLPASGLSLTTNRLFVPANITPTMTSLKQVLAAGLTVGQYGPAVIVSKVLTIATPVTAIRWDLKPDIQRRRANRQADGGRTTLTVP